MFQGSSFFINEESFEGEEPSYFENMRNLIIENGGIFVEKGKKSNYLIQADGHDQRVWESADVGCSLDDKNRILVHFR